MSDSRDAERRLQALASEPVPPADPTYVDQLDVRLRVLHVEQLEPPRSRPMWVPAVVGSVVIILMAVAGGLMLAGSPDATVIVMAASDTDIILPGDEATTARAGLHLPDGTRIIVGDSGEAVVNGVVLGPGSEATVVGDQIDITVTVLDEAAPIDRSGSEPLVIQVDGVDDDDRSPATTASDGNPASTPGPADNGRPAVTDRSGTDRGASDGTDNRSGGDGGVTTTTTRGQRSSTSLPTTAAVTSRIAPDLTTSTTGTTSSATNDRRPAPLELTVTPVRKDRLRLDWTLNRDVVPAGWRVRVRHGDRLMTLVAIRDGDARMITVELSIPVNGAVWTEALDREGNVLLASDPVEIGNN